MLGLRERMEENGSAPGTGEAKRSAAAPADPEVVDRPLRRRFSPSYKLRIVEEADRCTEPGEVGQLLRREGLYSSHLTTWRKAAHSGSLKALSKKRGRKPERNPLDEKVRKLERRNARLENELRKAHLIIDVQGKSCGAAGDKPRRRDKLLKAADELAKHVGVKPACAALEVSRSTLYRRRGPSTGQQQPRPTPARALSETERGEIFDTLCSERFVDRSPAEVVATLLDEEVYLCSERTMYRVLASEVPVQERRAQRTHPEYKKPELMATAPNQVWSWDITRLLGPKKWSYYYLYVIMDIYSRYVVGWMVADRENSALAGRLIQQSCLKHGVQPRVLTLHSDRGAPMTSQCTAQLLADLGVTRSLSRPQVSDDNPFSEAQFKTLKYHPSFPGRFEDQGQAKTFCRSFFRWYNAEHRHGGISMLTPEQVHFGNADQVIAGRKSVLREAWAAHPERFVRGVPKPKPLPEAVFINPPIPSLTTQDIAL